MTRGYEGDAVALGEDASVGHAEESTMLATKKDDAAVLEKRRRISGVGGEGCGLIGERLKDENCGKPCSRP